MNLLKNDLMDEFQIPFWKRKSLNVMNDEEWESLCDGCAKCCLHKLESEESGEVHYTSLACNLLNLRTCQCKDYFKRHERVPECVKITPDRIDEYKFLPYTCAYRLISENKPLPDWHLLISGSMETVHDEGISVKRFAKHPEPNEVFEHQLIEDP